MDDTHQQDICRVCRSEAAPDKPLYHPCVCTGSIRYIHQECLVQWLKYSKKEYCELCKHKFTFKPIYSPDMPKRLPVKDIFSGLLKSLARAVRYWFQSTLVALAWLGIVPLTACRIYRCLFTGSVSSLLTLPLDMLSTENVVSDCFQGCFVVTCTLCAFIGLVWLREQILHGGGPDWVAFDNFANRLPNMGQQRNVGHQVNQGGAAANQNNAEANQQAEGAQQAEGGEAVPGENPAPGDPNFDAANVDNNPQGQNNENEWNPIEWDRAAEELTWERLLGLDGSLVFLEHVFWVVSLNTLFILVFAFCPYHIGRFTVMGLKVESYFEGLKIPQLEGLLTTLLGYLIIALSLVILHTSASAVKLLKFKRLMGLCYIVVKVSLLIVVEIGIFPLICGLWLDICSLSMFDTTLKDRTTSFKLAPGTSFFIHWLVGMVYVFYFASFILLLREVLRPGVLWFLRNLNDPDFNPIHEMIHLPVYRHVRRFLASMVIFGSSVMLMLWVPVKTIRFIFPSFLPYNVMLSSDAPVSELSLELLLLQVVLPALLEQGHTRQWLKGIIRGWCVAMAWCLDLRSYLLGDVPIDEPAVVEAPEPHFGADLVGADESDDDQAEAEIANDEFPPEEDANDVIVADEHNGVMEQPEVAEQDGIEEEEWIDEREIVDPPMGIVDWVNGMIENAVEAVEGEGVEDGQEAQAGGVVPEINVIPPAENGAQAAAAGAANNAADQGLGAAHQAMLMGGGPTGFQAFQKPSLFPFRVVCLFLMMCFSLFIASTISYIVPVWIGRQLMRLWMKDGRVHELYTAACGLYSCWLILRAISITSHWIPQGWRAIWQRIKEWTILGAKSAVVAILLLGVVPLLLGLLFELIVVVPLRVPLDQSPVFFPWQDWALGVLHAKIICAVTMMGPQWRLKNAIEQVYNQGWRNMDLTFIVTSLCLPVIGVLGMCICVPYVFSKSIVPLFDLGFDTNNLVLRRIYPSLLCFVLLITFVVFQIKQFKKLYEHIKNDKYLVGQRLVNYQVRDTSRGISVST